MEGEGRFSDAAATRRARDAFSGGVNIETWSKYQTLLAFLVILRISLSFSASLRRIMDVCFLSGFLDLNTFYYIYIRSRPCYE